MTTTFKPRGDYLNEQVTKKYFGALEMYFSSKNVTMDSKKGLKE